MKRNERPEIQLLTVAVDSDAYSVDWAQSELLSNPPPTNPNVLSFLNEVEAFTRQILQAYGDYETAKKEALGVAFPIGADPAANQIRRCYKGAEIPADLNTAVELISHVKEARRYIIENDAPKAFFQGQLIQRYLQDPQTVSTRNKINASKRRNRPPTEEKKAARGLFSELMQLNKKVTWKHISKGLEDNGMEAKPSTIRGWLAEFRSDSKGEC